MTAADDRVLAALRAVPWVSGEALGAALGVSRVTIGQRVAALRRAGFTIAAARRRGYRLVAEPDRLLPEVVGPRLTTARFGRALRHLDECGSTNDEAAAWARAGAPEGALVVAERQRAGRGRAGRAWLSAPGAGVTASLVLRPPLAPHAAAPLTLCAGIAVHDALAGFGVAADLKWPNDVLADGRKLCGILTELSADLERVHYVILGFGINVNALEFPPALTACATSLRLAAGLDAPPLDRAAVLAATLASLERWYDYFLAAGAAPIAAEFADRSSLIGHAVSVQHGPDRLEGTAVGVDPDGALRVDVGDGGDVRVIAGEVLLWA